MHTPTSFSLETREVAMIAQTTPANIYVALCRSGSFRGITPRKMPSGRWLWPRDQIEKAFDLLPRLELPEGGAHLLGWMRTEGVPITADTMRLVHSLVSVDGGALWGGNLAVSDAALILDLCHRQSLCNRDGNLVRAVNRAEYLPERKMMMQEWAVSRQVQGGREGRTVARQRRPMTREKTGRVGKWEENYPALAMLSVGEGISKSVNLSYLWQVSNS